jgi:hypothetical protein
MTWIVAIVSIAVAIGAVATWRMARGETWRWGSVRVPGPVVGDGPYRSASITIERRRRLPASAAVGSAIGIAWGMFTLFLFAPMGILLSAVALPAARHGIFAALGGLGAVAATLSGFAIGHRLIYVSRSLVVRTPDSAERVAGVAAHSMVHHVLVMAAVAVIQYAGGWEANFLIVTAIPCAVGLGVAALLGVAAWRLRRLDRADATAAN